MANAGFQNYRLRRTFWYIETNVVLRRPPTPISKLLFEPHLLHYIDASQKNLALIGQAVSEEKTFEYYGNIHVYCHGVGAHEPLGSNFFQNH